MNSPSIAPWKVIVVAALGGAVVVGMLLIGGIHTGAHAGVQMELPEAVSSYQGTEQEVSESERVILPADTEFAKMLYKNLSGDQVVVQIVLAGAEKRSIHRPEVCLPAQGWSIVSRSVLPVKLPAGGLLEVTQLVISRKVQVGPNDFRDLKSVFLYWFVGDGVTTPHHWMRLLRTSWDRVVHRQNHRWAYVIVSAPALKGLAPDGRSVDETRALLESFIAEIAPEIIKERDPQHVSLKQ
jgi:EpsI family protein